MHKTVSRLSLIVLAVMALGRGAVAQNANSQQNPGAPQQQNLPSEGQQIRPNYVLGPNDQIMVRAQDVDELNQKVFRVEEDGTIIFPPPVGQLKVQGMTVQELERELIKRLQVTIRNPVVSIVLTQSRGDVVFFEGFFDRPGIKPLLGKRTLMEMLSEVGLQPTASHRLRLTRRMESGPIPLPTAVEHPEAKVSTVEINMRVFRESLNPAEDLVLQPYDTIFVDRAERIYVQGAVGKQGTVELDENDSISMLKVLTLSGGIAPDGNPSKAYILRPVLDSARRAILPVNLENIMAARTNDFPLLANDILVVPKRSSKWKDIGKAALIILPTTLGIVYGLVLR
jgi:polysaccharide export outer membrane protein